MIFFAGISTSVWVAIFGVIGVLGAALITGIFTVLAVRAKEDRDYRDQRIKTLEDREANVLSTVVKTMDKQQESVAAIGAFVTVLMDDRKYAERRRLEGRD